MTGDKCYCMDAVNVICPQHRTPPQPPPQGLWAPPSISVGDSLALFNRLGGIEESLRSIGASLQRIEGFVAPKKRAAPQRLPVAHTEALRALCEVTGVAPIAADKEALRGLLRAHSEEAAFAALHGVREEYRNGTLLRKTPAQFVIRNLIAEAGRRAALRGGAAPKVATWRPE